MIFFVDFGILGKILPKVRGHQVVWVGEEGDDEGSFDLFLHCIGKNRFLIFGFLITALDMESFFVKPVVVAIEFPPVFIFLVESKG